MAESLGIDLLIEPEAASMEEFRHDKKVVDIVMQETGGLGADVTLEMAGSNRALNTAIHSARRGGTVILFGIKNKDFILEDYNTIIVRGVRMLAIIGRHLWRTWERTRDILEDKELGVADLMWKVILNNGQETIIPIEEYDPASFEKTMSQHPKLLIRF